MQFQKNSVTLVGNMESKANVTNFENGGKVVRFKLRTNDQPSKKTKSSEKHSVFAWGNMANFIELYGDKDKELAIQGRLVKRTYLNRTGQKRQITEVEVKHVIGL